MQYWCTSRKQFGTTFFMIFLNDLLYALSCDVDNYADDTTLSATGNSVEFIEESLMTNCLKVSSLMQNYSLCTLLTSAMRNQHIVEKKTC